ncbi:MAG: amidohydrolase family protein [Variovorax sp.]
MTFIDTHHHLYDLDGEPDGYPALRGPLRATAFGDDAALRKNYGIEAYCADLTAMRGCRSVHIEAGRQPGDPVQESAWLASLAERTGLPSAIIANVDLGRPDAERMLARHAAFGRVRGIRQMATTSGGLVNLQPEDTQFLNPAWLANLPLLERHAWCLELQAPPGVALAAAGVARRHPEITFVLTHCGHPIDRTGAGMARWHAGLDAFAACANVVVKLSGFFMMNPSQTGDGVRAIVDAVLERFGAARSMFGSNFPVDRLFVGAADWRRMIDSAISERSQAERERLLAGTARAVYRIEAA